MNDIFLTRGARLSHGDLPPSPIPYPCTDGFSVLVESPDRLIITGPEGHSQIWERVSTPLPGSCHEIPGSL